MKKCASCSKDLPDAALHCVFCGAKQASAPVPAAAAATAKTVMGQFSASEMIQQLKASGGVPPQTPSAAPTLAAPAPYAPPPQPQPQQAHFRSEPSSYAPPQALAAPPSLPAPAAPHGVPQAQAQARTMIAQGPPPGSFGPATAGGGASASAWAPPPASAAPPPPAFAQSPVPTAPATTPGGPIPPYTPPTVQQAAPRVGHPIEPWKEPLRMLMLIFGALTLAYLVVPMTTEPMSFGFQAILDAEGTAKVPPILIAAMGLLGVIFAFTPMPTATRGLLAGLLAVSVAVVPTILAGLDHDLRWQVLAQIGAILFLLPGLVLRSQYRDSLLPRMLVTVGALSFLATVLVPEGDKLPLIGFIETLIDGSGAQRVRAAMQLAQVATVVLSLLVWLPTPGSGGAILWAWVLMLFPLLMNAVDLVLAGDIGSAITSRPARVLLDWTPAVTAFVLLGFGWASVFGKQLE